MKKLLLILPVALIFFACEKDDDNDQPAPESLLLNGLYEGTFHRTGMDTVTISISFHEGLFEGNSARTQYPAICRGSYTGENGSIQFSDSCVWQANFDWSLILNGRYELARDGDNVKMSRNNGATMDEYLLRRKTR
ncbi:MAG: hypothetical protein DI535_00595 [Citrobacter freundii]|nr:MAG: hypothetical protein DI535_00595 [Citrobacter freundii]